MEKKPLQKRSQLQSELYQKVGVIALEGGGVAIVDNELFDMLSAFRWRRVKYHRCYYARIIDGQSPPFKATTMHRVVNNTPSDMVCHHKNHNSLDNRRANLTNMSKDLHRKHHKNNTFKLKIIDAAISDNQPSLPLPDSDGLKKKAEINNGKSIEFPILSQLTSNIYECSKPPVMNDSYCSTALISTKPRAVNELF